MGKQLVLALFADEASAGHAVNEIKNWDKASPEVKLGAIGVLVKDEKGKIKTHKMGARKTKGGAVLFGLLGLLSGGITVMGGLVGGAVLGSLFHKGLKISKERQSILNSELDAGKAAVGLMVDDEEAEVVKAKLIELGGAPETYQVSDEAMQEAVAAAEAAPADEAPAEDQPAA
ncbi:MAG: hypothetical protein ACM30E_00230 [Nitrososphaerales archaeon]